MHFAYELALNVLCRSTNKNKHLIDETSDNYMHIESLEER